ncbi:MAG TPA: TauD/TfdA family dioxygenase [Aestuariivirgaceae bacterium]|nr:TauD/TfdA family dioxygenase [Aestuariivirgaceae bacterium]
MKFKAMLNEHPLTGHIGAEIGGLDLRQPVSQDLGGRLRDALARHQVLFFRDQHLSLDQLKALTGIFGPIMRLPYVAPLDGEPEVIRVLKEADERGGVFGGDWHTDFSFLERPPAGSALSADIVPAFGGDTVWASQAAAWDALSAPLQDLLAGRNAIHVGKPYGVRWAPPEAERSGASIQMTRGDPQADVERAHPAVLRNPLTGRAALFLNPLYVVRIEGLSEAESRPILEQIQRHATRPEFCCRFRWSPGTVAIWDNLFTQHYAVNDYHGHRRLMHRTTFAGPAPGDLAATRRREPNLAAAAQLKAATPARSSVSRPRQ